MKAIINGLRYDTDTAEALCAILNAPGWLSLNEAWLYFTPGGRFFAAGIEQYFDRPDTERIIDLSAKDARICLERQQTPEALKVLERYFENEDA